MRADLSGKVFSRLTVDSFVPGGSQVRWLCRCSCGNSCVVFASNLTRGNTKSCGCLKLKHGHSHSPTYSSWSSMMGRCTNPNAPDFGRYGGRGISVCEQWHSFAGFLSDMGERPKGCTLDRIDCNGNYEPSNCRWATQSIQSRNRRDSVVFTLNGVSMNMSDWAEKIGIARQVLAGRLSRGWKLEDALTKPPRKWNPR